MGVEEIKTRKDCPGFYYDKIFNNNNRCNLGVILCQLKKEEPLENCEDYQIHLQEKNKIKLPYSY